MDRDSGYGLGGYGLWLPEGADKKPVPAILEYIPYRKRDGTVVRSSLEVVA